MNKKQNKGLAGRMTKGLARGLNSPLFLAGAILLGVVLLGWWASIHSAVKKSASGREETLAYHFHETGQVLDPALFTGDVADAYRAATEMPEPMDHQHCYCECAAHMGHKTLLSCFTDKHASQCDICVYQGLTTKKMTDEGKTADEISKFFAAKFKR